jgi:hypothetical protein
MLTCGCACVSRENAGVAILQQHDMAATLPSPVRMTHCACVNADGSCACATHYNAGVGILQQHDMARNTPITLAQQRGHKQLAAELEQLRQQALGINSMSAVRVSGGSSYVAGSGGGRGRVTAAGSGRGFGRGRGAVAATELSGSASAAAQAEGALAAPPATLR